MAIHSPKIDQLAARRVSDLREFMEREIWLQIPSDLRGKGISRREREEILGYGPEGV